MLNKLNIGLPDQHVISNAEPPPETANHRQNIFFGLLQLGFPIDIALRLAQQRQGDDQQFNKLFDTAGSLGAVVDDGSEEEEDTGL